MSRSSTEEIRHFLDIHLLDAPVLRGIVAHAAQMKKQGRAAGKFLDGMGVALIFEKPSTRTRVSFERGIVQMGGQPILLAPTDMALAHGEPISDTAKVLSRYVDAIMLRTSEHKKLLDLAAHASVPVINGLTELSHPCQVMADIMTFEEHRGPIAGRKIAWIGDCNNVARSWIHAAPKFGFEMHIACPPELRAETDDAHVVWTNDAAEAAKGADCIITDVWVSMNDKDGPRRRGLLAGFVVDEALMAKAAPGAIFLHCLPARRGEEVSAAVIDGPSSAVWDEAENRMHAQKAILAWCVGTGPSFDESPA